MARISKSKSIESQDAANPSKKAYAELDNTARSLFQNDLKLHKANERFNQQIIQLHALQRLGSLINSTFNLEEILETVSELMAKELDFEKAGVVFLEPKGKKPMQSAYVGFSSMEFAYLLEHFDSLLRPVLFEDKEICLQTAGAAPAEWGSLLQSLSLSSLLVLPMRFNSRVTGFIAAGRSHVIMRIAESERRFYNMYSAQVATSVENARLYEALGQANLTLEEKVRERTQNLIDVNERLRDLDTAKSNFISLVSHELRTPLTSIKGFVTMLVHHDKEISGQKRQIYLNVLNEETDRLTRLIAELLDISRIESGHVEFNWAKVSVPDKARRVFEILAPQAKDVKLVTDFPAGFPAIGADADKIHQILINLIVNAVRYSPPKGKVTVSGRTSRDGVVVQVSDEGIGVPFNEQEKVFEKFYRQDNDVNRKNPGTGLGLSICRALINLHGGKIWIESEPGKGSHFFVSLPLNHDKFVAGREQEGSAPPAAAPPQRSPRG